jgi:Zn-dependent protease with chaperone function
VRDTAIFVFVMVGMIPVSWCLELKADQIAAKYVGKEHIKSALLKISKDVNEPSETHPSTADRIKTIDKLKVK